VPCLSDPELLILAHLTPSSTRPASKPMQIKVKSDDYTFFKKRMKLAPAGSASSSKEVVIYQMTKAEIEARKRKTPSKSSTRK